jgi:LuxR family transcriptional regulator, maltose regulon positive regulatory protein
MFVRNKCYQPCMPEGGVERETQMRMPLLSTKLQVPPPRRNLVARPRLIELLDRAAGEALHSKLTVLSAPAGFGKTTVLSEWVQSIQARGAPTAEIAWISLDEGDNDPARFAGYLFAALASVDEQKSGAGLDVSERGAVSLQESHLTWLINEIAARPHNLLLILDDYHLITARAIHDGLTFLVEHAPPNFHLLLATRADPPLPLPRLRARGHLAELRQSDLRFSTEEAAAFLNRVMGLDLPAHDVAALEARTEGWIAGLQMAALAMQARGQEPSGSTHAEFIRAFTGSDRFVLDYLTEEVLQHQPEGVKDFLLCTSVLERMCGPLCDALLEVWKGGKLVDWDGQPSNLPVLKPSNLLAHFDSANLFIVPLDHERRWYRYHRLFADLLRRRLLQAAPELVPALHARASLWYEQEGLVAEAIEHALAAGEFDRAANLVEASVEETFMRSEVTTFLRWVERLPQQAIRTRPTLGYFHAWALLMSGRPMAGIEERLEEIARDHVPSGSPGSMAGRLAALRAYYSVFQVDMRRAVELCHQALQHLPEDELFLRSVMAWILSLARLHDGDLHDGTQTLKELASKGQAAGNRLIAVMALCQQAKLQVRQGHLHLARQTYERALEAATDAAGRRLPIASEALIGLGELEREWNHLDAAVHHLTVGIELANEWSELAALDAYTPLARIRLALGDVAGARAAIEAARRIAERSQVTRVDDLIVELQEAYFSIKQGDVASAVAWAHRRGLFAARASEPSPDPDPQQDLLNDRLHKYERIVLARLFLLQARTGEALDTLESLLTLARSLERIDLLVEIQVLRALACDQAGLHAQAMDALAEALSLAEPGGQVRNFLDEGEALRALILDARSWIAEGRSQISSGERDRLIEYVDRLLAGFPGPFPSDLVPIQNQESGQDPLSERELDVLRLLATGMSNPEIADELIVAVSTVRSHCKSIYGKLDVHSRWDAVRRGQELDLI